MLSLSLSGSVDLGDVVPAVTRDYTTSVAAIVTSTGANATLTVADTDTVHPGHLVNGDLALAQPLQFEATDAATPMSIFAPLGANSLTLLTWNAPVSYDEVTVSVKQSVAQTDPLRTGSYSKTVLFTLSSTAP